MGIEGALGDLLVPPTLPRSAQWPPPAHSMCIFPCEVSLGVRATLPTWVISPWWHEDNAALSQPVTGGPPAYTPISLAPSPCPLGRAGSAHVAHPVQDFFMELSSSSTCSLSPSSLCVDLFLSCWTSHSPVGDFEQHLFNKLLNLKHSFWPSSVTETCPSEILRKEFHLTPKPTGTLGHTCWIYPGTAWLDSWLFFLSQSWLAFYALGML